MDNERERKTTKTFCYIMGCDDKPMWAVQNVSQKKGAKCCDLHLPGLLRVSGLPAYVNQFIEEEDTQKIKISSNDES